MFNFEYSSDISMVIIYFLTNESDVKMVMVTFMQHVFALFFNIYRFVTSTLPPEEIELVPEFSFVIIP